MAELHGMGGATPQEAGVRPQFTPVLTALREQFCERLAAPDSQFDVVARNAGLSHEEVEVLGLLAAVELEPARQRLVSYIQNKVTLPRPSLATHMERSVGFRQRPQRSATGRGCWPASPGAARRRRSSRPAVRG